MGEDTPKPPCLILAFPSSLLTESLHTHLALCGLVAQCPGSPKLPKGMSVTNSTADQE